MSNTPSNDLLAEVFLMVQGLREPLSENTRHQGWTQEALDKWLRIFEQIHAQIALGRYVPEGSLSRALDFDGVHSGELLERAARISNLLRKTN